MDINTGKNRITTFFWLILVDFIIATQIAAFSFFSEIFPNIRANLLNEFFLFSFFLSFIVFFIFSGVYQNDKEIKKIIYPGLVFIIFSHLISLFFVNPDWLVFGMIIGGFGSGMIMAGQIGMLWFLDLSAMKKFSLAMVISFFMGLIFGDKLITILSGPNLNELKTFSVLGVVIPIATILQLNQILENYAKWLGIYLIKEKKRLAVLGLGYLGNSALIIGFDCLLYPFVIWKWGILKGGLIMIILSFILCYAIILFYDWAKKDWLGIEAIKSVKEYNGRFILGRFFSRMMKRSDSIALIFLSIKFDPFITTVYMRHGSHKYSGLSKRDWKIFFVSLFIGNVYWTLVAFTGISVIEYFGEKLFSSVVIGK